MSLIMKTVDSKNKLTSNKQNLKNHGKSKTRFYARNKKSMVNK